MVGIGTAGIIASYSDKIFEYFSSLNEFAVYNLSWIVAASIFLIVPFSQGIRQNYQK